MASATKTLQASPEGSNAVGTDRDHITVIRKDLRDIGFPAPTPIPGWATMRVSYEREHSGNPYGADYAFYVECSSKRAESVGYLKAARLVREMLVGVNRGRASPVQRLELDVAITDEPQ